MLGYEVSLEMLCEPETIHKLNKDVGCTNPSCRYPEDVFFYSWYSHFLAVLKPKKRQSETDLEEKDSSNQIAQCVSCFDKMFCFHIENVCCVAGTDFS